MRVLLALGIFNLVNGLEVGTMSKGLVSSFTASTSQNSTQEFSVAFDQLRRQVDDLQHNLTYNLGQ